jgi:cytochrome c-type biogenesis protein CcmF
MFGKIMVYLSLVVSVITAIVYFMSVKKPNLIRVGRYGYTFLTLIFVAISIYLLTNILQHNYQLTYIWEYSSNQLHDWFLIASFYSGQQGSFLLWGLMIVIFGLFLIPSASRHGYESIAMGLYASILVFVVLMLIFKSPFD